MPPLKALAFDANETCLSLHPLAQRLPEVGLVPSDLELWFSQALRSAFAITVTHDFRPFPDVLAATLQALAESRGAHPAPEAIGSFIQGFQSLPVHADVAPAFDQAKRAGVRIAVVTNGSAATTRAAFRAAQLEHRIDEIVSVEEVQRFKPAREIYTLAAQRLGVAPGELALVAVHDWDIHGAKAAGLRTGYVCRGGRPMPPFMHVPDARADSLDAVVRALLHA
jgi:2-haloacid dehalogenase